MDDFNRIIVFLIEVRSSTQLPIQFPGHPNLSWETLNLDPYTDITARTVSMTKKSCHRRRKERKIVNYFLVRFILATFWTDGKEPGIIWIVLPL